MKKITAVLLAALMAVLLLAACGGASGEPDPNVGTYKLDTIMGMDMQTAADILGQDMTDYLQIILKEKGKGTIVVEGEEYSMKWEAEGTTLKIDDGSDSMEGTLEDGKISLVFEGSEVTFIKAE